MIMNFVRYKGTNLLNALWSTIWFKSAFFNFYIQLTMTLADIFQTVYALL